MDAGILTKEGDHKTFHFFEHRKSPQFYKRGYYIKKKKHDTAFFLIRHKKVFVL